MASTVSSSDLQEAVQATLAELFPGADLSDFSTTPRRGKVGGVVAWGGFEGMAQRDRQSTLWHALRARFAEAQLRRIGLIMTFTPQEIKWMDEG